MNERDEILLAAQEQPVTENEDYAFRRAIRSALIVTISIFLVMGVSEMLVFRKVDFGKPMLLFLFCGVLDIAEARQLQSRKKTIRGILLLIASAFFALLYIGGLFR